MTAADKDDLGTLVLGEGRTYVALVTDAAKASEVSDRLAVVCATAVERGWFSTLNQPPVMVGVDHLPGCVPRTNFSTNVAKALAEEEGGEEGEEGEEGDDQQWVAHRAVATKMADMYGIEIKVREGV